MPTARPQRKRQPLAPDRIFRAALELAEDGGVDALSMRKLAAVLNVDAMSIYHHVANKQALIMGIYETVLGELELPAEPELSWQDTLRALAGRFYRVAARYPRVFPHLMSSPYATERELEIHRFIRDTLLRTGLDDRDRARAAGAIYTYAAGIAGVAVNGLNLRPLYDPRGAQPEPPPACVDTEADFAFSVDLLIAGIESRVRNGRRG